MVQKSTDVGILSGDGPDPDGEIPSVLSSVLVIGPITNVKARRELVPSDTKRSFCFTVEELTATVDGVKEDLEAVTKTVEVYLVPTVLLGATLLAMQSGWGERCFLFHLWWLSTKISFDV